MAKRSLQPEEAFDLRQALHVATLEALLSSRRWEPGELVFQGGTCLHLAHGSPRFSEDLDFLVSNALKLDTIGEAVQTRLAGTAWFPKDTQIAVSKAKDGHNPHAFNVTLGGANVIGAVRVKVELWTADKARAIAPLQISVKPVRLATGPAAGMQTFVPVADQAEIYADKVFALGARPYLKPRDVFDLHWLPSQGGHVRPLSVLDMAIRLATYPNESVDRWLSKAAVRRAELAGSEDVVAADLKRWLPSTWPLTRKVVQSMIETAALALDGGIELMRDMQRLGLGQSPQDQAPHETDDLQENDGNSGQESDR
jgi:predicted nucleotidyltransferase component of viral defense system